MPREVVLFSGKSGKSYSIRHWKSPEMQTGIAGRMESAPYFISFPNTEKTEFIRAEEYFVTNFEVFQLFRDVRRNQIEELKP